MALYNTVVGIWIYSIRGITVHCYYTIIDSERRWNEEYCIRNVNKKERCEASQLVKSAWHYNYYIFLNLLQN